MLTGRPWSVTLIVILYLVTGIVGIIGHLSDLHPDVLWPIIAAVVALICAPFLFIGKNWARWLATGWMTFHVGLSAFHSWSQCAVHALFLVLIAAALFHRRANEFFRAKVP